MRLAFVIRGVVQGVGFRPFVERVARRSELTGWVRNGADAVRLEVQGSETAVVAFSYALERELPRPARITSLERAALAEVAERGFRILDSDALAPAMPLLPPDLATCADCWAEFRDEGSRRFEYPFTSCARCGPRYSITERLPYDRPGTSMRSFPLCAECEAEYGELEDRRYHAQPIACPRCGPELLWVDTGGCVVARRAPALDEAVAVLRRGGIVALQGLGGFQLLVDAEAPLAVRSLRERKRRPHKPFAVLFRDARELAEHARVSEAELSTLASSAAPIVLVERLPGSRLCPEVCGESRDVGALLPYTPLHALLVERFGHALVCTSGNLAEEPLATTLVDALARLRRIADGFLAHTRPIVRPLDDSVVRHTARGPLVVRRARGYAPLPVARLASRACVLALGSHLKSTVALCHRGSLVLSQHLGDLDSPSGRALLRATALDLLRFFVATPDRIACDLHPDYASTRLAEELAVERSLPLVRVQHHHAHVAAVMAEHAATGPVLGLAWDGTGLGLDGTLHGSDALVCQGGRMRPFARLAGFPLPGGERAVREPWRVALGALHAHAPERWAAELRHRAGPALERQWQALDAGVTPPMSSSVGRWFEAVAALLGLHEPQTFEGQTAIALETLARDSRGHSPFRVPLLEQGGELVGDMAPALRTLLDRRDGGARPCDLARAFHETLIAFGLEVAERAGIDTVVLSGGCFQNRLLLEGLSERLEQHGFRVLLPRDVPPNDGAISLGQAWVAAQMETVGPHALVAG